MTGKKLFSLTEVAISLVSYWSIRLSIRREGDGVKGGGEIVILARYRIYLFRINGSLV